MCIKYASCILYVKHNIVCVRRVHIVDIIWNHMYLSLPVYIYIIHYKDNIIEINIVCICILRALYIRWDVHTYCLCVHPACNSLSLSIYIYIYMYNLALSIFCCTPQEGKPRPKDTYACPCLQSAWVYVVGVIWHVSRVGQACLWFTRVCQRRFRKPWPISGVL